MNRDHDSFRQQGSFCTACLTEGPSFRKHVRFPPMKSALHEDDQQSSCYSLTLRFERFTNGLKDGNMARLIQHAVSPFPQRDFESNTMGSPSRRNQLTTSGMDPISEGEVTERAPSSKDHDVSPENCSPDAEQSDFFSNLKLEGFPSPDERTRPWQKLKRKTKQSKSGKVLVKCSGRYCYGALF